MSIFSFSCLTCRHKAASLEFEYLDFDGGSLNQYSQQSAPTSEQLNVLGVQCQYIQPLSNVPA